LSICQSSMETTVTSNSASVAPPASAALAALHIIPLAGAISGVVEGLSIQPLELIKTRFQINSGERMRLIPTIRAILQEGGVAQLYRGALPEVTGAQWLWLGKVHGEVCRATSLACQQWVQQLTFTIQNHNQVSVNT
jgi:hypothetical protein